MERDPEWARRRDREGDPLPAGVGGSVGGALLGAEPEPAPPQSLRPRRPQPRRRPECPWATPAARAASGAASVAAAARTVGLASTCSQAGFRRAEPALGSPPCGRGRSLRRPLPGRNYLENSSLGTQAAAWRLRVGARRMGAMSAEPDREPRTVSELLLAGIGWATMSVEAMEEIADDLARRVGVERDAMREAVSDTVASWRSAARARRRTARRGDGAGARQGGARAPRGGRGPRAAASRSSSIDCGCSSRPASPDRATLSRWPDAGPQRTLRASRRSGASPRGTGSATSSTAAVLGTSEQDGDRGRRLREMFDELGPTFVKFGQLLSTRPDVVPPDIIAELRKLQDDVTPVPMGEVERVIGEELGLTVEQAFLDFDETPIAAASIGQVHRATLPNGVEVVVKVQRPNAPRQIESDLKLMASAARVVARARPRSSTSSTRASSSTSSRRSIRQELDYQQEARNAETFRRNFAGDDAGRGAARAGGATRRPRVLTLERLEGTQFADLDLDAWDDDAAPRARVPDDRRVDDDDLPSRVLPRRPASRRTSSTSTTAGSGSSTSASPGGSPTTDMSRLTRLFVDAATENVEALPRRLADLGVRYPREREEELRSTARGALLPLLRLAPLGHRPDRGDPRGAST